MSSAAWTVLCLNCTCRTVLEERKPLHSRSVIFVTTWRAVPSVPFRLSCCQRDERTGVHRAIGFLVRTPTQMEKVCDTRGWTMWVRSKSTATTDRHWVTSLTSLIIQTRTSQWPDRTSNTLQRKKPIERKKPWEEEQTRHVLRTRKGCVIKGTEQLSRCCFHIRLPVLLFRLCVMCNKIAEIPRDHVRGNSLSCPSGCNMLFPLLHGTSLSCRRVRTLNYVFQHDPNASTTKTCWNMLKQDLIMCYMMFLRGRFCLPSFCIHAA